VLIIADVVAEVAVVGAGVVALLPVFQSTTVVEPPINPISQP